MKRRFLGPICLAFLLWLGAAGAALAQESSTEFWPETDIWLRVSPAWRYSLFLPLSQNVDTKYREGSFILQADYAWGKGKHPHRRRLLDEGRAIEMRRWLARAGYLNGMSLGDRGQKYLENTAFFELHFRTPLKGRVLVSHRLRTDLRWLGSDYAFSTRLRYRLMLEKEFGSGDLSFVPYANAEAYYDSRYSTVNRVRLIGGASVAWSPHFGLEANFTYQRDSRSSVRDLYVLNVILHLFFETRGARGPK